MTHIALETFKPYLQRARMNAVVGLTQAFRAGKQPQEIYPLVAKLVAIEDIETEMQLTVMRGESAGKELNEQANTST